MTAVGYVPEPLITIRQSRPDDYPDIYKDETWSWRRQQILYEIHAANRKSLDQRRVVDRLNWWRFRFRVSLETAKWLSYALVRRKRDMIETCKDGETPYDQFWLRAYRQLIHTVA